MAATETRYEHIVRDENGTILIAGTTIKVVELVTTQQANSWSPEELAFQFPHLTLGQIHSALAYYWDHQAVMDQVIARRQAMAADLQRRTPRAPLQDRLARARID
ncbi:MAG: DUF433 domain-containing protein [Chloroflexi bacterium]|nr:DUF433 domain-containing protein [Chloroflexota bacterium]